MVKSLRSVYCMAALATVGACSTVGHGDKANLETVEQAQPGPTELGGDLDTRPLHAVCRSDFKDNHPSLEGRGSAADITPWLGITAGGFVFNTMLMGLSPAVALEDRQALENKVSQVLDGDSDGRTIEWIAPASGESVVLRPKGTQSQFKLITVPRAQEVSRTPSSFRIERGSYVTTQAAALRPSPTVSADVRIQNVPVDSKLEVMGRVRGLHSENWYLVGNDGRAYGYMEPSSLRPVEFGDPTPIFRRSTGPTVKDAIGATVTCRDLGVSTANGEASVNACRLPGGKWVANLEDASPGGLPACLPVAGPFLLK